MRLFSTFIHSKGILFFILLCLFSGSASWAQQTSMQDYVLFSGNGTCAGGDNQKYPGQPGYAVQLGSFANIQGGSIGSYRLVKSTGSAIINANIYSGGTIRLANGNVVTGRITAANDPAVQGTILSAGWSSTIGGNIDVNGNIYIGGGHVGGAVTHPSGTSYSGPVPAGGNITAQPSLPILPKMPLIAKFPAYAHIPDINSTKTIAPGIYGGIRLQGYKTITFNGPGEYTFDKIDNNGNNYFVFDFKNDPSATFKINIHRDADLGKIKVTTINGGDASRIFTEVHGNGSSCSNRTWGFSIANGYSAGSATRWLGTVWVPYAAINVGSGFGNSNITGALWSGTQVNIQCGARIIFAPYSECTAPNVNAGADKALDFANLTTLTGSSTTPGVKYNWQAINGGVITSPANVATITVSAAGTYVLTATSSTNCTANDTAVITGKSNNLIGSELQSVFQNFDPNGPPSPFFVIQHDSIVIDVITKEGKYAAALALLTSPAYGLTGILSNGNSNFIITGLFQISKLPLLNALDSLIVYARPYYAAYSNSGLVTSAGDTSLRSDLVRDGYKVQGEGIKIGVISDSYDRIQTATTNPIITNTAAQDVSNDDLPGTGNLKGNTIPVTVLQDYPVRRSDEGRAMLQIVHDIAPKASLYFRTGFISSGDFAMGIDELKQAGCNIIVDDVTFITEPFLKDGVIASAVDAAVAGGTTYFSAAGNFAGKSYENSFNPVAAPAGITGTAHNFGGNDVFQNVNLSPGNYTIVLQWLDDIYSLGQTATGGTKNDLDIYLTPNTDGTALFGFNRNNTNGDPIEILPFTLTSAVNTNILITNNTVGSTPARFKFVVFRGDITFNEYKTGTSTVVGQANALGAIAVGAARYDKAPPFPGPLVVEDFSSNGGTYVNNIQRNKPELVAPDGANTTVNLGVDYDHNLYSNFFGTSAAAPHAAAVAALIMEGRKKFLNQPSTTPAEIRSILQTSATDMNTPGFDFTSGYGFVNADSAMRTFAKPAPSLVRLVYPSTTTPGQAPFTLTIRGVNLSVNSVITFRGTPLATTVLNSTEATAVIPPFTGNPPISIYTPPISLSNLDGGYSDTLYFSDSAKKVITIIAENKTKKYAEQLPGFTAKILIDNIPLDSTTLTLQDLGLTSLGFVTQATSNSNVGTYVTTPSRAFDPADSADVGLQEKYRYNFSIGNLTIDKMPLTVTPVDKTIAYGQHVGEITFNYQFDQSKVPDPAGVLNLIKAYHQAFLPGNALAVVQGGSTLSPGDLSNLNMMATFNAVKNSRKFKLENDKLVPVTDANSFNVQYLVDISAQSITDYKNSPGTSSFINGFPGINSKAVLSASSLDNNTGKVLVNGSLVQLVNGSLVQMVNSTAGPLVPILNGSLVQIVNGSLVQLVNGDTVAIPNGSLVQLVNGSLVQLVNGELVPIANGSLVQLVNGSLVQLVNGSLVQLVNGVQVPIINGSLVQLVNGSLVQLVNGVPVVIPNGSLVQLVNGSLVQLVNGSLVQLVNGSLVQLVNGSLVQLVNGSLVQIVNGNTIGATTPNNNTAVIIDQSDVDFQTNWIGPMFGINMITGLDAGQQKLVPGVLVNENFDITYGTGNVNILPTSICITPTPGLAKVYGTGDPVFTYTNDAGLPAAAFTGALGRESGDDVGEYQYKLGNLSAGVNYVLHLSTTPPVATFRITPKPVCVTPIAGQSKVYGDPDPVFTFTNNGGLSANNFTGMLARMAGSNAGNYNYTIGSLSAGDNIILTLTGTNTFAITKASLQVTANDKVISKGDPLPSFTSTITGLRNGDNPTVKYSLSPNCAGQAGIYAIVPCLNPFANLTNYTVSYTNGQLYINPKGLWAKKLRPYLDCVEALSAGKYIAHFYCINDNSTPVYVAVGMDNKLSSAGSFESSGQPFIFKPGITRYDIPFDGSQLTWDLRTYDSYDKVLSSASASASSGKCNMYTSTARSAGTNNKVKKSLKDVAEIVPGANVNVYPNPAGKRTTIYFSDHVINGKGLSLFDAAGRSYPVGIVKQLSKHSVEIDVSRLASGMYFMRVKVENGYKTVSIVKE